MMIGLVTEEGEEGEEEGGKSHCKVGTRWVRQTLRLTSKKLNKNLKKEEY